MREVFVSNAKHLYELALGKRDSVIGETINGKRVIITPKTIYVPGLKTLLEPTEV